MAVSESNYDLTVQDDEEEAEGISSWSELLAIEEQCEKPYKEPEVLQFLYWGGESYTQDDIAERYFVSQQTVSRAMAECGVPATYQRAGPFPPHLSDKNHAPYVEWRVNTEEGVKVLRRHQLVALLSTNPHEVFSDGMEVHHKFDSSMALDFGANLELLTKEEHLKRHASEESEVNDVLSELGGE